jgi:outer membrane lipoprotein SlyB
VKTVQSVKVKLLVLAASSLPFLGTGCAGPQYQSRQSEINNAIIGATIGGVIGGVIGNNIGDGNNQVLGAAIGAAGGAWAGQQVGQGQDMTRHRIESLERQSSTTTVMIKNSNGSFTPVHLINIGNGQFKGPRGEIYYGMPSGDQLASVYGF